MNITQYIANYFLNKDHECTLNRDTVLAFNYIHNAFLTSIEFIEMIANFEEYFSIQFLDEHLKNPAFSVVGSLIKIVDELVQKSAK